MYGVLCGDVRWTAACMAFCGIKQPGLESDQSSPYSAKVKNE